MFIVFNFDLEIVWEKSHGRPEYAKSIKRQKNPPAAAPHLPSLLSADAGPQVLQKPCIFLLQMAAVDDGKCWPYVAEWADAGPTWYGLPM